MKNKISVKDFVSEFKNKKIQNTKISPNAVENFLADKLEIIPYIPFMDKRKIAEMVINGNATNEYDIIKIDSAGEFVSFVVAMLVSHTNLQFDAENTINDYDALSECGVLEYIIAQFKKDYSECEVVLKMVRADVLADNNLSVIIAKFLDGILDKLDGVGDMLKDVVGKIDLDKMINLGLNETEVGKVKMLLNKYIK